jgi:radical SAM protein with 4Fe4S-binding SPASM domain
MTEGHVSMKSEELSTVQWKAVLDLLSRHGVHNICFTGGEALLRSDLLEIIDYASQLKIKIIKEESARLAEQVSAPKLYLLSNGKLVDDTVLDMCKRNNVQLSVSMPGLRTFSELTGGGDVDKILRVFEKARERGLSTVVGITVTKKNLFELYETISAAFLAGATQLLLNRFLEGGRGRRYAQELALSRDDLIIMLDVAEQALHDAGRYGSVGTELPLCLFNPDKYKRLEISTGCSAAKDFFVIGPSGKVRVCNHSPIELAHYAEIGTLKMNPYWMKFAQSDYLPAMCNGCKDVGRCAGGCREAAHIVGGAIDAPDALLV